MLSPARQYGEVLVVLDGSRRVVWGPHGDGCATPVGLWPDADQQAAVWHRLVRQAPLLVIMEHDEARLTLLPSELPSQASPLWDLLERDGELAELCVPRLEWLPAPLRTRGLDFLHSQHGTLANDPTQPEVLVDPWIGSSVRFAWRRTPRALSDHHLEMLAGRVFDSPPARSGPVAGWTPPAPRRSAVNAGPDPIREQRAGVNAGAAARVPARTAVGAAVSGRAA